MECPCDPCRGAEDERDRFKQRQAPLVGKDLRRRAADALKMISFE
jgi:hypothetical protein